VTIKQTPVLVVEAQPINNRNFAAGISRRDRTKKFLLDDPFDPVI
jgi:hypothetical protein